jgi:hypothetical protein
MQPSFGFNPPTSPEVWLNPFSNLNQSGGSQLQPKPNSE